MKKQISTQIVADSVGPKGNRITTFLLTYPRFIHGELMTHRVFSRNSASSRAIPFEKMVKMVEEDPFIPIAWQKDHKGMQGSEYITDQKIINFKSGVWLQARNEAIHRAKELNGNLQRARNPFDIEELEDTGVTKQLCNRLLEPFMWHTTLVSATEFDNFFELRCPSYMGEGKRYYSWKDYIKEYREFKGKELDFPTKDLLNTSQAEIHIQALAESMWDVMNESTPKKLQAGEWHIPFGDKLDEHDIFHNLKIGDRNLWGIKSFRKELDKARIAIATARCARLSYMTFDGVIDYEKDIKLHDQLLESEHYSPFEHCARAMTQLEYRNFTKTTPFPDENGDTESEGWCNNFRGFISYRYLTQNKRYL